jgi:hypothetical protein
MSSRRNRLWTLLAFGALPMFFASMGAQTRAQLQQDPSAFSLAPRAGTTNYRFAEPNELTITVSIIGEVRLPGRYEISRTINLVDLVALAGGWGPDADPSDVTIMKTTMIGGRLERKNIVVDLADPARVPERLLELQQGDHIAVGRSSWTTTQKYMIFLTAAAVLVNTYISILTYKNTK